MNKKYKKNRFKLVSAVHLFLFRNDKILLLRRLNTGYCDGQYSVIAGHLDGNEKAKEAMLREAKEEAGIEINTKNLKLAHIMHRKSEDERIDFFFAANVWTGKPSIMEPDKCDDLSWFNLSQLPKNIIPYVKTGIKKLPQPCSLFRIRLG